jgi:hypothetical protein
MYFHHLLLTEQRASARGVSIDVVK